MGPSKLGKKICSKITSKGGTLLRVPPLLVKTRDKSAYRDEITSEKIKKGKKWRKVGHYHTIAYSFVSILSRNTYDHQSSFIHSFIVCWVGIFIINRRLCACAFVCVCVCACTRKCRRTLTPSRRTKRTKRKFCSGPPFDCQIGSFISTNKKKRGLHIHNHYCTSHDVTNWTDHSTAHSVWCVNSLLGVDGTHKCQSFSLSLSLSLGQYGRLGETWRDVTRLYIFDGT